jgi:hypothetical protein
MRFPGRWVVSFGLTLAASGCLPTTSQPVSLGAPPAAHLVTAADRPGNRPTPAAEMSSSTKQWLLIGGGALVLILVVILISGGSDYSPGEGRLAPIP